MLNLNFKKIFVIILTTLLLVAYNFSFAESLSSSQSNDPTAKTSDSWFTNLFSPTKTPTVDNSQPTPVPSSSLAPTTPLTPTKTPTSGSGVDTTNTYTDGGTIFTGSTGKTSSVTTPSSSIGSSCNVTSISDFKSLVINIVNCLLSPLVKIMVGLSIVIFIWGVFKFIKSDSVEDKGTGRAFMFWGVVGLFVMLSLWGLVNVLQNTFVLEDDITPRQIDINL